MNNEDTPKNNMRSRGPHGPGPRGLKILKVQ